jgi:hypothetical protein
VEVSDCEELWGLLTGDYVTDLLMSFSVLSKSIKFIK